MRKRKKKVERKIGIKNNRERCRERDIEINKERVR